MHSTHVKKHSGLGLGMMSGPLKANIAIETASETSPQLLPGTPPHSCAAPGSSAPTPPDDSPAGPSSTSSPFSRLQHTPATGNYKTTYHIARPNRKLQDWSFKGRKPVLVLGDSNINRIPPHNNPNVTGCSLTGPQSRHWISLVLTESLLAQENKQAGCGGRVLAGSRIPGKARTRENVNEETQGTPWSLRKNKGNKNWLNNETKEKRGSGTDIEVRYRTRRN